MGYAPNMNPFYRQNRQYNPREMGNVTWNNYMPNYHQSNQSQQNYSYNTSHHHQQQYYGQQNDGFYSEQPTNSSYYANQHNPPSSSYQHQYNTPPPNNIRWGNPPNPPY